MKKSRRNKIIEQGLAPWKLVLWRLSEHRLAMAGLLLVLMVLAFVLFGKCLVDTHAEETRLWIGAKPPGYSHPHCLSELFFTQGQPPRLEGKTARCQTLVYRVRENLKREVRIALRRGKVQSITEGANALENLNLAHIEPPVYELLENGETGRLVPKTEILKGQLPPKHLFSGGQRVIYLTWRQKGELQEYNIEKERGKAGRVVSISLRTDGQAQRLESCRMTGQDVEAVLGDDRELTLKHPLGTDELGRDVCLRIVNGGRISLLVAAVATLVSLVVGVGYGALSGYVGGRTDNLMMRVVDILYGLPFIFLVLLLMVVFDRNIILLFAALGLVQWLTMARIVRGQIISLKNQEFVEAARMGGASDCRIILFHLLPHALGPIVVYATLTVPIVILEESFLAFIGLPVQFQGTTLDSWGSLVHLGMASLGESGEKWWLLVFPSLAMVLTLFGLNCFGDGLRDSLDPRGGQ